MESPLIEELYEKGCVKGCGGCCGVGPTEEELEVVEQNAKHLYQYPKKEIRSSHRHRKNIIVEHEDGTQTKIKTICPFTYTADSNDNPLPYIETRDGTVIMRARDKDGNMKKTSFYRPEVVVKGPKEFQILCAIHQDIRDNKAIGDLFYGCAMWSYGLEPHMGELCKKIVAACTKRLGNSK